MMSLFAAFNPISTLNLSLGWIMLVIPMIVIQPTFWKPAPTMMSPMKMFASMMSNQFNSTINKSLTPNTLLSINIMIIIMTMNMSGLLPMVFPLTSQVAINMSMAITMWSASMLNKMKTMKMMMAHMNPMSTPYPLIPLMVMIETVSLLIQPMTLAIRLTANITAGHILMTLITIPYNSLPMTLYMINMILHLMFTMLELAVSIIQAYVFSMLVTMYFNP